MDQEAGIAIGLREISRLNIFCPPRQLRRETVSQVGLRSEIPQV
jgi:hypothetical protein